MTEEEWDILDKLASFTGFRKGALLRRAMAGQHIVLVEYDAGPSASEKPQLEIFLEPA